jgi:hypothetical protein
VARINVGHKRWSDEKGKEVIRKKDMKTWKQNKTRTKITFLPPPPP